jgi:hypothetical protein
MFDLSALDAELDGLGRAPENTTSLAEAFSGFKLSGSLAQRLEQVDAELSMLSNGTYRAPAPPAPALSGVMLLSHEPAPQREASFGARTEPLVSTAAPEREHYPEPEPSPELGPSYASEPPQPEAEHAVFQHAASTRAPALTESQEIVLPDPIAREELSSESGELSLGGSDPESGSFELPDSPTEPRITPEDVPQEESALAGSHELDPFDDVQDALEGSQPIAVSANRATLGPGADLDRDPDAEFDALLSEATDPRGIPTVGASSEFDTDDLLRGLEGGEPGEHEVGLDALDDGTPHEADMLTRSLYEDSSDNTDILDRATLGAIESSARGSDTRPDDDDADDTLASLMTPDELDSGELEIIDDEPTLALQSPLTIPAPAKPPPPKAPTARPGLSNKAPPPPPPSGNPSKRPSGGLLGRLFTKREGE